MRAIYITMLLALTITRAFAGGEVGNGGNVIVCNDISGNVKSVEVLDYYELRLNGGVLSLNPNLVTYQEKLSELFDQWIEFAPKRMAQYKKWLQEFQTEAGIYSGIEIPHIPDTGSIAIPQGCKPISIAFQRADDDIFPGTKRYVINKDLWDYMNETQKAGLVLHELIYREAIKAGHPTSQPTRYFNGYLSSATPNGEEYAFIVSKLPLLWVEYGGGIILEIGKLDNGCGIGGSCNPYFYRTTSIFENGKIVKGRVIEVIDDFQLNGWQFKFLTKNIKVNDSFDFNQLTGEIESYLNFYEFSLDNKFYFHLKNEKEPVSFFSVNNIGLVNFYFANYLKDSWIMNGDGNIIRDIYLMNRGGYSFTTTNGSVWTWNKAKKMYIQEQYFIQLKKEQFECVPKNNKIYECLKMPTKLICKVPVFGTQEEITNENLAVISSLVEFQVEPNITTYSTYKILLPKGQIVGYEKKFGKTKPIKLSVDSYRTIEKIGDDGCLLSSYN